MADITSSFLADLDGRAVLKTALGTIGDWMVRVGEANSRSDQIERLSAMSDAELARRGITRDRIVQYVFRDLSHI